MTSFQVKTEVAPEAEDGEVESDEEDNLVNITFVC